MSSNANISPRVSSKKSHPLNLDEQAIIGYKKISPSKPKKSSHRFSSVSHEASINNYIEDKKLIHYIYDNQLEGYFVSTIQRVETFFSKKPDVALKTDFETGRQIISILLNSDLDTEAEFEQLTLMFQDWALIEDTTYNTHFNIS